jgi:hypothetical protein
MDRKARLFISALITIIVLLIICLWAWISPIAQTSRIFVVMPPILLMIGFLVFTAVYRLLDKGFAGFFDPRFNQSTNATLTCKNGHRCPVWVQFSGRGLWYDFEEGGTTYHIGGGPKIIPATCPECGAHWVVPHKHEKSKPLKH